MMKTMKLSLEYRMVPNNAFRADRFGFFPYIQVNRPAAQTLSRYTANKTNNTFNLKKR